MNTTEKEMLLPDVKVGDWVKITNGYATTLMQIDRVTPKRVHIGSDCYSRETGYSPHRFTVYGRSIIGVATPSEIEIWKARVEAERIEQEKSLEAEIKQQQDKERYVNMFHRIAKVYPTVFGTGWSIEFTCLTEPQIKELSELVKGWRK